MRIPGPDLIKRTYDYVYISPHLDDVAFSCGGCIREQVENNKQILVVTVFSRIIEKSRLSQARAFQHLVDMKKRRTEDELAMNRLGVDFLWLDYPDAIFRYRFPLRRFRMRSKVRGPENKISREIEDDIKKIYLITKPLKLYLPLGIGQHIDHLLLFLTGDMLRGYEIINNSIIYYEDFPYFLYSFAMAHRLKELGVRYDSIWPERARKITGILRQASFFMDFLVNNPSLKLKRNGVQPLIWSFLLLSTFYTHHCSQLFQLTPKNRAISTDLVDISRNINDKLQVIQEYRSQIILGSWNIDSIERANALYSRMIGKKKYLERYWHFK